MKNCALAVAGTIFGLVALIHLIRLFYHFPIIVGGSPMPLWVNVIGFLVAGGLSAWMFRARHNIEI